MRKLMAVLVAALAATTASAVPITLTQGALSVTIRDDSGAINNVTFGGTEFYRQGTFVSDFGFQNGTTASTFRLNTTNGSAGTAITLTGTSTAVVTGNYNGVAFTRTYSLVPGLDVLKVSTSFTNTTGGAVSLRYFDTADPDQGIGLGGGFDTKNDVTTRNGTQVGVSTASTGTGYTVVVGGPGGIVGYGTSFGLGISDGNTLNTFFTSPSDPNGVSQDIGWANGYGFTLGAGQSTTVTSFQAFGTTPGNALSAFDAAAATPEPVSLVVFGGLIVGGAGIALRRRMVKAAV